MKIIKFILLIMFANVALTLYAQDAASEKQYKRPKVGLVFSGGGAKGYAYIGFLKVLHEINMPVDYIGGSSIGAIVGAMYSVGYHPDTIEKIVRSQDWDAIISNYLDRRYRAFEERRFSEKVFFSVPIDSNKLTLGPALTESMSVDLLLNRIFSVAYDIDDFNELEIPFLCMGTDLITGESIVLNKGSLPQAIRASMAIPGYFSPAFYQGHYLIDGGVVNNYPAEQVKKMGADIIIGGDVQEKLVTNIDELNSIPKILDHIVGYQRIEANTRGRALTDYYVRFEMNYSMMDFNQYDSIIAIGKRVAMDHYDQLKSLADSLNGIQYTAPRKLNASIKEDFAIDDILIDGNEKLKRKVVNNFFKEDHYDSLSISEIEESIKLLAGTNSFKNLNYSLYKQANKTKLKLCFDKVGQGVLSAGMNYNNDYNANLNLSFAFRNLWNTRAKLFSDVIIGQSPRFYTLFLINNGKIPGFGFDIDMYRFNFSNYHDGRKQNNWAYRNLSSSVFMPITLNNSVLFKTGFQYDYFSFEQDILSGTDSIEKGSYNNAQLFGSIYIDNRDRAYFSSRGGKFQLNVKHSWPFESTTDSITNNTYAVLRYQQNIRMLNKFVFKPSLFIGYSLKNDSRVPNHLYAIGGQSSFSYMEGFESFTGLRFVEHYGLYAGVLKTHLQYNIYDKFYFTLMGDYGFVEWNLKNVDVMDMAIGFGGKLSYDSFIGPISISVMGSNETGVSYFLNIGYPLK